jgi:RNA polymerase sigma-70 factor (ECF subfamily)
MDAAAAEAFTPARPQLLRVAYRMLGSIADAEDVVQEAFVRWSSADRAGVREPEAFLRRIVTRLCLDQLSSARYRRETYIGPWLPDPIVAADDAGDVDAEVTLPLMLALERLSPLERAAFLLHDVFGLSFSEVAATIGRDHAACRQLAARGRVHIRDARPRFAIDQKRGLEIAEAFFLASRSGDMSALSALLARDVSLHADGGGKRSAAMQPFFGISEVAEVLQALAEHFRCRGSKLVRVALVNGLPGFVTREADGELQTTALDIHKGRIVAIYVVRNPDKLRHLH